MALDRSAIAAQNLHVTKDGKTTLMAVSKMTDAQILAALARADNAGALTAGWTYANGSIVRAAQPAVSNPVGAAPPTGTGSNKAAVVNPVGGNTAPPTAAPVTGYLKVREKQPDGTWKVVVMQSSKMTDAQRKAALANGLNGPIPGSTSAGAGASSGAAAPAPAAPAPNPTSWIPRVSLNATGGMLNAQTGAIDWSAILNAANTIAAVDPQYASDLSNNILTAQQQLAPLQGQYQALVTHVVDPITGADTGKNKYQTLLDSENSVFGQNQSSVYGNAARRGILSSGMTNQNLSKNNIAHLQNVDQLSNTYGPAAQTAIYNQMLGILGQQDQGNTSAYYAAIGRAQAGIPTVAGAIGMS